MSRNGTYPGGLRRAGSAPAGAPPPVAGEPLPVAQCGVADTAVMRPGHGRRGDRGASVAGAPRCFRPALYPGSRRTAKPAAKPTSGRGGRGARSDSPVTLAGRGSDCRVREIAACAVRPDHPGRAAVRDGEYGFQMDMPTGPRRVGASHAPLVQRSGRGRECRAGGGVKWCVRARTLRLACDDPCFSLKYTKMKENLAKEEGYCG